MSPQTRRAHSLAEYRELVARTDEALVGLYAERRALVEELMAFKLEHGLSPFDPVQEETVVQRARERASRTGASPEDAERLMRWVLAEVHRSCAPLGLPILRGA